MDRTHSFGYWVRRQRLALDLTQAALARRVGCAAITVRKIEADERRPSRQMAERLAQALAIPEPDVARFVAAGLGERPTDTLPVAREPLGPGGEPPGWLQKAARSAPEERFVGRDEELAQMAAHLESALAGDGRVIFVSGEAGQGKTALLAEFARRAQDAHAALIVAQGYCAAASGMGQPYLPFRDILVSLSGDLEARWQAGLLDAEQVERLWRFAPTAARTIQAVGSHLVDVLVPSQSLGQGTPRQAGGPRSLQMASPGEEAQQNQVFEQLTTVLRELSKERPLLLILDDLQWVDAASASLIFHLVRRLAGARVLIAGAFRPDQAPARPDAQAQETLRQAILESGRLFGETQIDLQQLNPPEGRRLSDMLLDREPNQLPEAFRVKLFWQTRANPLFVIELLREMKAQGRLVKDDSGRWVQSDATDWDAIPRRVTAVIEQRLARLGKEARWILDIASVEGERFTVAVVAAISGLQEGRLLRMLSSDLAEGHGLVEELGESQAGERRLARFRFRHVLFQHYLYEALNGSQRRLLHGQIADELAQLYEADQDRMLPELAHHYDAAGRQEEAIHYLIEAGDRARQIYAVDEASDHLRRAIALLRETGERERLARTWMKLGLAHQTAFDYEGAQRAFDEAFALWSRLAETPSWAPAEGSGAEVGRAPHPLRVLWQEPGSLDPTMGGYNLTAPIANQIFSGLVAFGPQSEVVPDVAHRWEISDGGRRYVFHLRDDVVWSDGEAVTAYDFEFTYLRALAPQTAAPIAGQLLSAVKGAEAFHAGQADDAASVGVRAVDEHTLVFELAKPTSYFIYNLAYYVLLPVPRHVVRRLGKAWARPGNIVTNGPFLLAAWEPGRHILLRRNPAYHGVFSGNLEEVLLTLEHEPAAQDALYLQNELDVASSWFGTLQAIDRLRRRFPDEYVQRPGFITYYYFLDVTIPPLDDARVRQALVMALDRRLLASAYYGGYAAPAAGGFVPPGMPGHLPEGALPFDAQKARDLLEEGGFGGGQAFPTLTVLFMEKAAPVAQLLQRGWREHLGIGVELKMMAGADWAAERQSASHPIVIGGWIADYPDPDNFLRVDVQFDVPEWQDEAYTDLLQRAAEILDQEARLALYQQAERILLQEAVVVPLLYVPQHFMLKPWVRRYPTSAVKNPGFWKDVIMETGDGRRGTGEIGD